MLTDKIHNYNAFSYQLLVTDFLLIKFGLQQDWH